MRWLLYQPLKQLCRIPLLFICLNLVTCYEYSWEYSSSYSSSIIYYLLWVSRSCCSKFIVLDSFFIVFCSSDILLLLSLIVWIVNGWHSLWKVFIFICFYCYFICSSRSSCYSFFQINSLLKYLFIKLMYNWFLMKYSFSFFCFFLRYYYIKAINICVY